MTDTTLQVRPWAARACLAGWLGVTVLGVILTGRTTPSAPGATGGAGDVALYQGIAERVAGGEPYYSAAVAEQLAHGYPTTPAMTVRPPTLTMMETLLGQFGLTVALVAVSLAAGLAVIFAMGRAGATRFELAVALIVLAAGSALAAVGPVAWFHDAWAGALLIGAVALYRPRRWWPSLLLALLATSIRELAVVFLLVMAGLAWRRRAELLGWLGGVVLAGLAYLGHAAAVASAQPDAPVPSQGWLQLGGWGFVLDSVRFSTMLSVLPAVVTAVAVPLALLGWFGTGTRGRPALALCLTLCVLSLVIGRPENSYWGLLYATLLLVGLAFAPRALTALWRSAVGGDSATPSDAQP